MQPMQGRLSRRALGAWMAATLAEAGLILGGLWPKHAGAAQAPSAPEAPRCLDGWNHYYAMAHLAELEGIPREKLQFAHLVPDLPYAAHPDDSQPYFLPFGGQVKPWDLGKGSAFAMMRRICHYTGFLFGLLPDGSLTYAYPLFLGKREWITDPVLRAFKAAREGQGAPLTREELDSYFRYTLRERVATAEAIFGIPGTEVGFAPGIGVQEL